MKNVILIGDGLIGSEIKNRAKVFGLNVAAVFKKSGIYEGDGKKIDEIDNYKKYSQNGNLVFLAIPTSDTGEIASDYLQFFLKLGIPVVTCEKGALSNYFPELKKYIGKIGYSATVGGGTRMLSFLNGRIKSEIKEVHGVINGTLNYVFTEISKGVDSEQAIKSAIKKGFTNPGVSGLIDVMNDELKDVMMKAVIAANVFDNLFELRLRDLNIEYLDSKSVLSLIKKAKDYRCLFSISKKSHPDRIAGFSHKAGDWFIEVGFQPITQVQFILPDGVNNTLAITEGENSYQVSGPGAGAVPTALSMIKDALDLLNR